MVERDDSLVLNAMVMRKAAVTFFVLPFIQRNRLQCGRVVLGRARDAGIRTLQPANSRIARFGNLTVIQWHTKISIKFRTRRSTFDYCTHPISSSLRVDPSLIVESIGSRPKVSFRGTRGESRGALRDRYDPLRTRLLFSNGNVRVSSESRMNIPDEQLNSKNCLLSVNFSM